MHVRPQLLQFLASVCTLVQNPEQRLRPVAQDSNFHSPLPSVPRKVVKVPELSSKLANFARGSCGLPAVPLLSVTLFQVAPVSVLKKTPESAPAASNVLASKGANATRLG